VRFRPYRLPCAAPLRSLFWPSRRIPPPPAFVAAANAISEPRRSAVTRSRSSGPKYHGVTVARITCVEIGSGPPISCDHVSSTRGSICAKVRRAEDRAGRDFLAGDHQPLAARVNSHRRKRASAERDGFGINLPWKRPMVGRQSCARSRFFSAAALCPTPNSAGPPRGSAARESLSEARRTVMALVHESRLRS